MSILNKFGIEHLLVVPSLPRSSEFFSFFFLAKNAQLGSCLSVKRLSIAWLRPVLELDGDEIDLHVFTVRCSSCTFSFSVHAWSTAAVAF
jgi:hypothetical protein